MRPGLVLGTSVAGLADLLWSQLPAKYAREESYGDSPLSTRVTPKERGTVSWPVILYGIDVIHHSLWPQVHVGLLCPLMVKSRHNLYRMLV